MRCGEAVKYIQIQMLAQFQGLNCCSLSELKEHCEIEEVNKVSYTDDVKVVLQGCQNQLWKGTFADFSSIGTEVNESKANGSLISVPLTCPSMPLQAHL